MNEILLLNPLFDLSTFHLFLLYNCVELFANNN